MPAGMADILNALGNIQFAVMFFRLSKFPLLIFMPADAIRFALLNLHRPRTYQADQIGIAESP